MTSKFLIILTVLFFSCSKKVYTLDECEELSMQKFKGYQRESHLFDNNCQAMDIHYTQQRCQKSLKALILGTTMDQLKASQGPLIDQCFTENDIKNFSK